jgi:hypothetical protein
LRTRQAATGWRLGVQRMLAVTAERRMTDDARSNATMVHREQQHYARQALHYLWNSVRDILMEEDPSATVGELRPDVDPYFVVGDFRFMLTLTDPPSPPTSLLYIGSLIANREGNVGIGDGVFPANLVCVWKDDAPHWVIVRFTADHSTKSRLGGIGTPPLSLAYDGSNFTAPDRSQVLKEVATPDLILDIFQEAIGL